MISLRLLALPILSVALFSCAAENPNQYDTPNANNYTNPSPSQANAAVNAPVNAPVNIPVNPVYDTPAAYEVPANPAPPINKPYVAKIPKVPSTPIAPKPKATPPPATTAPKIQAAPTSGTMHTVVAGDTLSGISAKYKVPVAAIKQANGMTKDTVILGKKMVIPTAN